MGLGDRIRAWLRGDDGAAGPPAGRSSRGLGTGRGRRGGVGARRGRDRAGADFDGDDLLAFARSRGGVEVYLEPRTNLYGVSVLLVADDGEYLRRPVPDAETVRRFCAEHGIPVYDAARTGYPRRVRDYDRGVRPQRVELDDLPPWPGPDVSRPARGGPGVDGSDVDGGRADDGADDGGDEDDEPPPPPVT